MKLGCGKVFTQLSTTPRRHVVRMMGELTETRKMNTFEEENKSPSTVIRGLYVSAGEVPHYMYLYLVECSLLRAV